MKGIVCTGVTAMYGLGWPGGVSAGGVRYHTGIPKVKLGRERVAMMGTEQTPAGDQGKVSDRWGNDQEG